MTIDITRLRELLDKSLGRAYSLGQTYWMQADSEYYSQNRKAYETQTKFDRMRAETNVEFAALLSELERKDAEVQRLREALAEVLSKEGFPLASHRSCGDESRRRLQSTEPRKG